MNTRISLFFLLLFTCSVSLFAHDYPGTLITLEGIDGSGKTTLRNHLAEQLRAEGYEVITTREPGGSELGTKIRTLLLEGKKRRNPRTEYLLFAADRAEHFTTVVIPALQKGAVVISDRMADSAMAYQGHASGMNTAVIAQVNQFAMHDIIPDCTLYLRITPAIAAQRRAKRNEKVTAMEKEKNDFFQRVVDGYDLLAKNEQRFHTIDATHSLGEVYTDAYNTVKTLLPTNGSPTSGDDDLIER